MNNLKIRLHLLTNTIKTNDTLHPRHFRETQTKIKIAQLFTKISDTQNSTTPSTNVLTGFIPFTEQEKRIMNIFMNIYEHRNRKPIDAQHLFPSQTLRNTQVRNRLRDENRNRTVHKCSRNPVPCSRNVHKFTL